MADTITANQNPRRIMASFDRFMSGLDLNADDLATANAVICAASFGAAAYEAGTDADQATHAMARAFLCALIDPACPDMDYLRAHPAAGEAMRSTSKPQPGQSKRTHIKYLSLRISRQRSEINQLKQQFAAMGKVFDDDEEPLGHCEVCSKAIMPGDKATYGGPDGLWVCEEDSATLQDQIDWLRGILDENADDDYADWYFDTKEEVISALAKAEAEMAATGNRTMAAVRHG